MPPHFRVLPAFAGLAACLLALPAAAATPPMDILYGHFEIHADYVLTPGNPDAGWQLNVSYNKNDNFNDRTQIVRLAPETTTIIASPRTGMNNSGVPITITSAVSRLGPVGAPLWLMPQNNILGTPFMGARAVMDPGIFQTFFNGNYSPSATGSISLRLVSVTGTGPDAGGQFGLWESDGQTLLFYFGPQTNNLIPTLPPNAHSHFNWGFTKPGSYFLTIEALGRLNPQHGGQLTSTQKVFRFAVPFSSRLSGQATVRAGFDPAGKNFHLLLEDAADNVAYAPTQGFLEASAAASGDAQTTLPGAARQMQLTFSTAGSQVANVVGLAPALAAQGLPAGALAGDSVKLRLLSVSGPGHFALLSADGTGLLMNSADGVDAADEITLASGADLEALAVFTANGLYRVTVELAGTQGGETVKSGPLVLAFGANLTAAYTYAQWRDSFERTHGLPANALADTRADFDKDGISNGAEFQLFWHGCDPVKGDAGLLPKGRPEGGAAVMDFLRDTYKDTLNEKTFQQSPGTSPDMKTWATRNARVTGRALETCETGAEQGNAYGRVMLRRLRVLDAPGEKRFFRFIFKPD